MSKALSIVAFVFSFVFPIVGLILGIIAVVKAKDDPQALKGLAIAAIVIGGIFTLLFFVLILAGVSWYLIGAPSSGIGLERCFLSQPLQCSLSGANSDSISLTIKNYNFAQIELNSVKINGCGISNEKILVPRSGSNLVKVDCLEELDSGLFKGDVSVTFTTEGKEITEVSYGDLYTNIN